MEELTDTQEGASQPSLLNLDWLLISVGVGILAVLPTFLTLMIRPDRLAGRLQGGRGGDASHALGPGQFFTLSVIVFVLIGSLLSRMSERQESPSDPVNSETANAARAFGRGIRSFIETTADRLASGDIWNAALIALPLFLFSVALGLLLYGLMSLCRRATGGTARWDVRHSMGAALYMIGGLSFWAAVLMAISLLRYLDAIPVAAGGLAVIVVLLAALTGLGAQAYGFARGQGIDEGAGLFFAAASVPFLVIGMIVVWVMAVF
ncbi:MAG: hypothetical protein WBG08_11255 [Litorimonas sp.]